MILNPSDPEFKSAARLFAKYMGPEFFDAKNARDVDEYINDKAFLGTWREDFGASEFVPYVNGAPFAAAMDRVLGAAEKFSEYPVKTMEDAMFLVWMEDLAQSLKDGLR